MIQYGVFFFFFFFFFFLFFFLVERFIILFDVILSFFFLGQNLRFHNYLHLTTYLNIILFVIFYFHNFNCAHLLTPLLVAILKAVITVFSNITSILYCRLEFELVIGVFSRFL